MMLKAVDRPTNSRGDLESPTPRRMPESML